MTLLQTIYWLFDVNLHVCS